MIFFWESRDLQICSWFWTTCFFSGIRFRPVVWGLNWSLISLLVFFQPWEPWWVHDLKVEPLKTWRFVRKSVQCRRNHVMYAWKSLKTNMDNNIIHNLYRYIRFHEEIRFLIVTWSTVFQCWAAESNICFTLWKICRASSYPVIDGTGIFTFMDGWTIFHPRSMGTKCYWRYTPMI